MYDEETMGTVNWTRRGFLRTAPVAGIARLAGAQSAVSTQPIVCRVIDSMSGRPVPARVRLVDARGDELVPLDHSRELADDAQQGDVRFQSRRYDYVDGEFRVDPRRLPIQYQVIKGYEYTIAAGELDAKTTRDGVFSIPLSRWSAISGRGWYGGDNHIHHISPKTCRLEMDAEDLNVANILTSDFTKDQREFEGRLNKYSGSHSLIYVNQEFRNDHLGHMCLLNLKELIQPVETMQPNCYPLHAKVCDRAHAQGGYVTWAHFPSNAMPRESAGRGAGEVGRPGDFVRDRAARAAGLRQEAGTGDVGQQRTAHVVPVFELRLSVDCDRGHRQDDNLRDRGRKPRVRARRGRVHLPELD
jgi:hypothetical protein